MLTNTWEVCEELKTVITNVLMETSTKYTLCFTTAAVAVVGTVSLCYFKNKLRRPKDAAEIFNYLKIETVKTEQCCDRVVSELSRRSDKLRALGFDCEWVTKKDGKRHPVAYIQLSSYDGYCGLFNLVALKTVPQSLKNLLEDETLFKVGVAPMDDSQNLFHDYSVETKCTLDLRHLAEYCGHEAGGLASLSKTLLGAIMDKSWKVRCSDWEADQLTDRQVTYAATDAHAAIRIYAVLLQQLRRKNTWFLWRNDTDTDDFCRLYIDRKYKSKHKNNLNPRQAETRAKASVFIKIATSALGMNTASRRQKEMKVTKRYPNATRCKPLYHNCTLYAPDDELLCTCDSKKAMWYVEKELADVIKEEPLAVRLRFEPSGRSVGDVGRYYKLQKENKCVVCGNSNSYIRKNVIPREYRKYLPEIMKDHSSHDVVLLCVACHQLSNMRDQAVRERLARLCRAPIGSHPNSKRYNEDAACKKIRSAARALYQQTRKHDLPEKRRKELEEIVLNYYTDHDEITVDLLQEASQLQVIYENADYESHGMKVVEYYLKHDGLLRLEEEWREHFLNCMKPKYMPELWSIKHNEERLRVKWEEGRLTPEQLQLIGLTRL